MAWSRFGLLALVASCGAFAPVGRVAAPRCAPLAAGVVTPGNFKNGLTIEYQDGVWKVMSFQQSKTARQAAVVRTKLKNLVTGATVEDTFRMTESFQQAQVESNEAVFSYEDGDEFVEIRVQKEDIASCDLLKDGMTVSIVKWGEVVVDINLPSSDTYEVTYTEPGLKKAASSGQSKAATLETGAEIQVPLETGAEIQ